MTAGGDGSQAAGARPFRFLFMADCQLGCYASFSGMSAEEARRYAERDMRVDPVPRVEGWEWDAQRLREAVTAANRLRPDLIVVGGDMVDDLAVDGQYAELTRIAADLDGIPLHWVPGNHDAAYDGEIPTPDSLAAYRRRFGPDHYAFEHEGVAFIALNTVVLARPEHVGAEADAQMAFLESALRDAGGHARHILVFGHHPLFTRDPDEPDSFWNIPRARRREILGLLQSFGVRAFFCGHWHRNGGGWADGVEVVVSGPVGYPLGQDPPGFRIIEVDRDRVDHRYVGLAAEATAGGERR